MTRRKSKAQRSEESRRDLHSFESKTKVMVSDVLGGRGLVHTNSHFQDPRKTIGHAITEALDPSKAPRTISIQYFDTSTPVLPTLARKTGPGTMTALAKINARIDRKRALTRIADRKKRDTLYLARGLSSISDVEEPVKPDADIRTQEAVDFLTKWLSAGPRKAEDIKKDAQRDGVGLAALVRARKLLGVITYPRGTWQIGPRVEATSTIGMRETWDRQMEQRVLLAMKDHGTMDTDDIVRAISRESESTAGRLCDWHKAHAAILRLVDNGAVELMEGPPWKTPYVRRRSRLGVEYVDYSGQKKSLVFRLK